MRQANRMRELGKFRRKITAREHVEMNHDRITLDCGHQLVCMVWDEGEDRDCPKCMDAWLRQEKA